MSSLRVGWFLVLIASVASISCTTQPNAAKPVDPSDALYAIPLPDPARYERIEDMKSWRNPYLIVRTDRVDLLDTVGDAEIHLKPEELVSALAKLPPSAWPYGRVVAVAEGGARTSEQDAVAIRRNKGIVGGILQGVKINVKWVPGA